MLITLLLTSLFIAVVAMKTAVHFKCRGGNYPFTTIARLVFPDDVVAWTTPFKDYNPLEYNSPSLKGKPYADPDLGKLPSHIFLPSSS